MPITCSVCGTKKWKLNPTLFEMRSFESGELLLSGVVLVPFVILGCEHCGNTLLFNAIKFGLVPADAGEPSWPPKAWETP